MAVAAAGTGPSAPAYKLSFRCADTCPESATRGMRLPDCRAWPPLVLSVVTRCGTHFSTLHNRQRCCSAAPPAVHATAVIHRLLVSVKNLLIFTCRPACKCALDDDAAVISQPSASHTSVQSAAADPAPAGLYFATLQVQAPACCRPHTAPLVRHVCSLCHRASMLECCTGSSQVIAAAGHPPQGL